MIHCKSQIYLGRGGEVGGKGTKKGGTILPVNNSHTHSKPAAMCYVAVLLPNCEGSHSERLFICFASTGHLNVFLKFEFTNCRFLGGLTEATSQTTFYTYPPQQFSVNLHPRLGMVWSH